MTGELKVFYDDASIKRRLQLGNIRIVRDPHNLSVSRLHAFFGCPARSGYESFYEGQRIKAVPFWLPGGTAVHSIDDQMIKESVEAGRIFTAEEVTEKVESARKKLWLVLMGKIPPKGFDPKRIQDIMWMPEEERQRLDQDILEKRIRERISRYINQVLNGIKAMAMRCSVPSPFEKVQSGVGFKLDLLSARNSSIRIPVWGEIDLLEWLSGRQVVMTDWKTGNFNNFLQEDLEANDQMLVYWFAVREMFGIDPLAAYFVSVNVYKSDLERYEAATLEQQQYRVQARIRFHEHWPELLREFDDVWAVLNFLAYPAKTPEQQREQDNWEPSSEKGRRFGFKHLVQQQRLIPSIGRHCGMCPAKSWCQADNAEDWEVYNRNQKLGNVVDKPMIIPEEWVNPLDREDLPLALEVVESQNEPLHPQLRLFGHSRKLNRSKLAAKDWKALGFFTARELEATLRYMKSIIPVVGGHQCPCAKTDRLPAYFLPYAYKFFLERSEHKLQQADAGNQKVRDLYDSRVVCELIKDCPVPGCIHSRKQEEEKKVS